MAVAALVLYGCGGSDEDRAVAAFPSTYEPLPSSAVLIQNATVLTGAGERIDDGAVFIVNGRIEAVGARLRAPRNAQVIDAAGKWITPGIIDSHSHLGLYPSPGVAAHSDGNEVTGPNTAEVWGEHSIWPQDPGFASALAGGVTAMHILPGSANLFGGRGVVVKNVASRTVQGMKFPGAPHTLKMACGENPKRVYGRHDKAPMTRMGNVAGYRQAWADAQSYMARVEKAEEGAGEPPDRNLRLETLAEVLRGNITVHNHCYRADEMAIMLDVAQEFGYKVAAFHHATEAYKIADLLAEHGTCAAVWADWWGFKMEAYDSIRENAAFVDRAGACAIVHSDSGLGIQRLNQEAAKAMAAGQRAGLAIAPETAIAWITLNPARSLGIDTETGSIERGKMADLVIWDGDPFSVYTRAEKVFVDGALVYDSADPALQPVSDFSLGTRDDTGGAP